jgi:hypothetical protein
MKFWYEFWITYYDDEGNLFTNHGIFNATSFKDAVEQASAFYGESQIQSIDIKLVNTWEDAPWLFDVAQEVNPARYWKADEQAKFFD